MTRNVVRLATLVVFAFMAMSCTDWFGPESEKAAVPAHKAEDAIRQESERSGVPIGGQRDFRNVIVDVAKKNIPAVVHIEVTQSQEIANPFAPFEDDPFFRRFFDFPQGPRKFKRELKGIGPARATAIVAYRQQHGPFRSVDDLSLIKGIGKSVIDRNRADLRIGNAPPVAARPAVPAAAVRPPAKPAGR